MLYAICPPNPTDYRGSVYASHPAVPGSILTSDWWEIRTHKNPYKIELSFKGPLRRCISKK